MKRFNIEIKKMNKWILFTVSISLVVCFILLVTSVLLNFPEIRNLIAYYSKPNYYSDSIEDYPNNLMSIQSQRNRLYTESTTDDSGSGIWDLTMPCLVPLETTSVTIESCVFRSEGMVHNLTMPSLQAFVEYSFNSVDDFNAELARISSISFNSKTVYDTVHFCLPAYVALLGHAGASEYILIDQENQKMIYVCIEVVPFKSIVFDKTYLPIGYQEYGLSDGTDICIY